MLRVEALEKSYATRDGTVQAVRGVSFEIPPGRFFTLLGPSGCGKTTTLRCVAGLERPSAGRITMNGAVLADAADDTFVPAFRRDIGMVFQSYAIWPHMSVFTNVAYPLEVRRRPSAEVRERALAALRLVQMEHLAERPATALSGGQQQRVAIARALVFQPRVLQQRLGITTIYVTHDQEEAMVLSDEIAVMHEGRVLQTAAPEALYARPANRTVAAFFGAPNLLAAKTREVRRGADAALARVEG